MDTLPDSLQLDFLPQITGSFSSPAQQNPTSAMIEAAYQHHGIHARYVNCEVPAAGLEDAVRGARAMGWIGFNCSLPHKQKVIAYLDGLGESASLIGAVNCVVNREGKLIGENTDGSGFLIALRSVIEPAGKRFVILGAGGAARAITVELALAGAGSLTVVNRNEERAREIARVITEKTKIHAAATKWTGAYKLPEKTDVLVNATSVGFYPDVNALVNVDLDTLSAATIVCDVIPNPPRTALLREAAARGCVTLDGLGMLVYQGVASIKHWTGESVDPDVMRRKLEEIFRVSR
jgi:shikimate dehydrogenase